MMLFDKKDNELTPIGVISLHFGLKFELLMDVTVRIRGIRDL